MRLNYSPAARIERRMGISTSVLYRKIVQDYVDEAFSPYSGVQGKSLEVRDFP